MAVRRGAFEVLELPEQRPKVGGMLECSMWRTERWIRTIHRGILGDEVREVTEHPIKGLLGRPLYSLWPLL